MLNPKARDELPPQAPEAAARDAERRAGEPRCFPAYGDTAKPSRWDVRAPWPHGWANLAPDALIRFPVDPANAAEPLDEEAARRRALLVIPCLNEAPLIAQVIGRLLEDEGLVDPLIVVADGGSTDGSRQIVAEIAARDPRVRLLPNPGRLQSAGVNLAARAMGGERPWLVRIDAHADYPKAYVSTLIEEARRTGAQAVVVAMETRGEQAFQRAVAAAQNSRLGTGGAAHRLSAQAGWVDHGHHALFNREAYERIGGYDESFSHNEDAELDLRLTREGARIWLTERTRIVYRPRKTPGSLWRQYVSYGKGRARTVLKHFTPLKLRQALPLAVAPAVVGAFAAPFYWPLAVPAAIWAAVALGYGVILAVRARDAAVALSGPAAMIMHLAWSIGFWMQLGRWLAGGGRLRPPKARLQTATVAS